MRLIVQARTHSHILLGKLAPLDGNLTKETKPDGSGRNPAGSSVNQKD